MYLETERLNNYKNSIKDAIGPRMLKISQEYYALAVLRSLFPDEYNSLIRKESDRPDLKDISDEFGVEVTTADSSNDNEDNRLLFQYGDSKEKEKIRSIIEKHGKRIVDINSITHISSGGWI